MPSQLLSLAVGGGLLGYSVYGIIRGVLPPSEIVKLNKALSLPSLRIERWFHVQWPRVVRYEESAEGVLYWIRCPEGIGITELERHRSALELVVGAPCEFAQDGQLVRMRVWGRNVPQFVEYHFDEIVQRLRESSFILGIPIGYSCRGLEVVDLAVRPPHLLIGGQTGGGKSVSIRGILTTLVLTQSPDRLQIYLIDLKRGVEFSLFKAAPHVKGFGDTINSAREVLTLVNKRLDNRFALFEREKYVSINQYNSLNSEPIPHILVVVDELAEFCPKDVPSRRSGDSDEMDDRKVREKIMGQISRLLRLGRAAGIHVVLSTQRPDADVLPGQLKANIPATLAFKVREQFNSFILLGHGNTAASDIPDIPGRAIWQYQGDLEVQVAFLSEEGVTELLFSKFGGSV